MRCKRCVKSLRSFWSFADDKEEVKVLERRGGWGTQNSTENRMREVSRRVRMCWDLWGRVARAQREEGGGWG